MPVRTRIRINQLGLSDDLEQELHLSYYESIAACAAPEDLSRAMHASGERFRYREVVRRAKYEVPEELAGASYHRLVYGIEPNEESGID